MHHVQGAMRRKLPSIILLFACCVFALLLAPISGGLAIIATVGGTFALALGVLALWPLRAGRPPQPQQTVQPPPGPAGQQGLSGPVQGGPPPGPPTAG